MEIKFHGQSCFELSEGETTVLVDPFLKPNNPAAVATAEDVEPTHIAISHGHIDHIADAVPVATRTGAHCVAIVEIAKWLEGQGVTAVSDPNLGGTVEFDWGWVKLVPAWHTSTISGSEESPYSAEHGIVTGTAGGPADQHRRRHRLPRRRHLPVRRHEADRRAQPGRRRPAADRRPLHDGPPRRRDCGRVRRRRHGDPDALRHLPADRDRRGRLQAGCRVEDLLEGRRARPGESHSV